MVKELGRKLEANGATDKEQISLALGSSEARERSLDLLGLSEHEQDDLNLGKETTKEVTKDDTFHDQLEVSNATHGRPEAAKRSERAVEVGTWKGQKQIRKSIQLRAAIHAAKDMAASTETKADDEAPRLAKYKVKELVYDDSIGSDELIPTVLDDLC